MSCCFEVVSQFGRSKGVDIAVCPAKLKHYPLIFTPFR
jgi:hypothetical protein